MQELWKIVLEQKLAVRQFFLDVKKLDGGPSRQVIRLRHSVRRISVKSVVSVVCVFSDSYKWTVELWTAWTDTTSRLVSIL